MVDIADFKTITVASRLGFLTKDFQMRHSNLGHKEPKLFCLIMAKTRLFWQGLPCCSQGDSATLHRIKPSFSAFDLCAGSIAR